MTEVEKMVTHSYDRSRESGNLLHIADLQTENRSRGKLFDMAEVKEDSIYGMHLGRLMEMNNRTLQLGP